MEAGAQYSHGKAFQKNKQTKKHHQPRNEREQRMPTLKEGGGGERGRRGVTKGKLHVDAALVSSVSQVKKEKSAVCRGSCHTAADAIHGV